ncbi:MAG: hypothetical protein ABR572_09325 [Cryomorphaceae bacterium]|nr:hypothetical protein [Flavobacteriales bacterium]
MKQILYLLLPLLLLYACQDSRPKVLEIDFSTNYKFAAEIEERLRTDTMPWKYQSAAADYANKGDYKNALLQWDLGMRPQERSYSSHEVDSVMRTYTLVNAGEYIAREAQKTRVVIINEAHHNSMHRAFTRPLLRELFALGYSNLGLEALHTDSALNGRGYPIQSSGYYLQEPQFALLVRDALDLGYHVFAYEHTDEGGGKPREIGQAKNIQKVIDARPNEKFLIHCGFAHALEGNYSPWEKAMAGRLAEYTGIDPLTINQEFYSEKSKPAYDHPLLKALELEEASVLLDQNSKAISYERGEAHTDIAVLHPTTQYLDGRPHWLFANGNKKVSISLKDVDIVYPVMVMAFQKGEDIREAIPADITEVQHKDEPCTLGLKPGEYTIVVYNGTQAMQFEKRVK